VGEGMVLINLIYLKCGWGGGGVLINKFKLFKLWRGWELDWF